MKKSIGAGMVVLTLLVVICFSLFCVVMFSPSEKTNEPPLIHQVDEITADGDCFYTLDDTLNNICKYSNEGELEYALSFSSFGANYIFINQEGNLNRYDLRANTVFVYDDSGNLLKEDSLSYQDFKQIRDTQQQERVVVKEIEYCFQNRLIRSSFVNIRFENGKTINVIVETAWGHIACNFFIFIFFAGFAYSFFQIAFYSLSKYNDKNKKTGVRSQHPSYPKNDSEKT